MRVAVAVSGGADSLCCLPLLKERGLDLVAVHGFFLPPPEDRSGVDALAGQCAALGVPFHAIDLHQAFRREVIAPFAREYAAGRTPNPCALCNPRMKFGLLFDAARERGATHIATGHYATMLDVPGQGRALARGADPVKDQSYFLSLVPRERLEQAIFPLGTWRKEAVKALLRERGITPPLPAESQEICFIPDDDYCAFLESGNAPLDSPLPGPGPIVLANGTRLGTHGGLWRYTLGQRRGMGIAYAEPLYVVGKDVAANALVVGTGDALASHGCTVRDLNLLAPFALWPPTILVQTRYRQRAKPATATLEDTPGGPRLRLAFIEPHSLPAPGQIAAVYASDGTVLGGGIIEG
ncbi:MAG: tRNA 2-thiouridine(34) synthase MnmA [Desulfovibrionaceae bacterium]